MARTIVTKKMVTDYLAPLTTCFLFLITLNSIVSLMSFWGMFGVHLSDNLPASDIIKSAITEVAMISVLIGVSAVVNAIARKNTPSLAATITSVVLFTIITIILYVQIGYSLPIIMGIAMIGAIIVSYVLYRLGILSGIIEDSFLRFWFLELITMSIALSIAFGNIKARLIIENVNYTRIISLKIVGDTTLSYQKYKYIGTLGERTFIVDTLNSCTIWINNSQILEMKMDIYSDEKNRFVGVDFLPHVERPFSF